MKKGHFRQDLYFRLNVISLNIPPLRDRRNDVILLLKHFFQTSGDPSNLLKKISNQAEAYLANYDWPGNVRELYNVAERIYNVNSGQYIDVEHLPEEIVDKSNHTKSSEENHLAPEQRDLAMLAKETRSLYKQQLIELERRHINELLERHHGNISLIAKELGVSRTTLYKKIKSTSRSCKTDTVNTM